MTNRAGYLCPPSASRDKGIYTDPRRMGEAVRWSGDELWVKYRQKLWITN